MVRVRIWVWVWVWVWVRVSPNPNLTLILNPRAVADDGDVEGGARVRARVGAAPVLHVARVDGHVAGPHEHADRQRACAAFAVAFAVGRARRRGGRAVEVCPRADLEGAHLGVDLDERKLQLEGLRLARALRGGRRVRVEGLARVGVRLRVRVRLRLRIRLRLRVRLRLRL